MKKINIVKDNKEFNRIIDTGKKLVGNYFIIYYKDNNLKYSRYGISVGTKLGNAVTRNKYKRKIRMIITENNLYNYSKDIIILMRKQGLNKSYQELNNNLLKLIQSIKEN